MKYVNKPRTVAGVHLLTVWVQIKHLTISGTNVTQWLAGFLDALGGVQAKYVYSIGK